MQTPFQRLRADQSGKTLVIALIIMGVASLLIGGFLYYVSTSQRLTTSVQEQMEEHYAADAGVEHAVWQLTNDDAFAENVINAADEGDVIVYTETVNGETVVITVSVAP